MYQSKDIYWVSTRYILIQFKLFYLSLKFEMIHLNSNNFYLQKLPAIKMSGAYPLNYRRS